MTKEERCRLTADCHNKGINCAQSVLLAFRDITGLSEAQSLAVASGFGGGMRCGGICGSVSGAIVVLGCRYPAMDAETKKRSTVLTREFQRRFSEQFGALNCKELLAAKGLKGTPIAEELMPDNHCGLMICSAVELLCDYLNELEKE